MDRSISRRRGFTLVELLVVIGIIALLISILMPALTKARNQALMIKCMNQGRQIYLASTMFAADNKGNLPRPSIGPADNDINAEKVCYFCAPEWGVLDYKRGVMVQYMPGGPDVRKDVFLCPGDLGEVTQGGGAAAHGDKRNFSYSLNANITQTETSGRKLGIRLQSVRNAAKKIMIYEEQGPNDMWCLLYDTNLLPPAPGSTALPAFRGDDIPGARHAGQRYGLIDRSTAYGSAAWNKYGPIGRANYTFFDGHVETLTPNDLYRNPKSFMIKAVE